MKELICKSDEEGKRLIVTKSKITFLVYAGISLILSIALLAFLKNQPGGFNKKWMFYSAIIIFLILSLIKYLRPVLFSFRLVFDAKQQTLLINQSTLKKFSDVDSILIQNKNHLDSNTSLLIIKFTDKSHYIIVKSDASLQKNLKKTASTIASFTGKPLKVTGDSAFN